VTVLRARANLYGKQVFYCTKWYNIAVYLYCYLDGIRCSWIIRSAVSCVKPYSTPYLHVSQKVQA